jgi:glycosyltransferase involved in cell wall biosynthesis
VIRIHFAYRHVDRPWGGANNFIRALHADLAASGHFTLTQDIEEPCDILFMNQLGMGPAAGSGQWPLRKIERLLARGSVRKLVVRAVNLNSHAFRHGVRYLLFGRRLDKAVLRLLDMAHHAVFQSAYQLEFFTAAGYIGTRSSVIHNGADPRYWVATPASVPLAGTLRLLSSTASPRASKRHDLIARMAAFEGVEVAHAGAWPESSGSGKVRLLGTLTPERMRESFAQAHYLLHPAVRDPCPNVLFEAMCAGLPVIYHPGPGSSAEIVGRCGLALDEHNLGATVEAARAEFDRARAHVLRERPAFRIEAAAALYRDVFERVVAAG